MSRTSKIILTIELDVDGNFGQNSKDGSEREWFREHLLRDELLLHSSLVGDTIGSVKVLSKRCRWVYDEDIDAYETECGHTFILIDGTPAENNMKFCTYCVGELCESCGKLNDGVRCRMQKGSKCPDCGVGLHDFGGPD